MRIKSCPNCQHKMGVILCKDEGCGCLCTTHLHVAALEAEVASLTAELNRLKDFATAPSPK